MEFSDLLRDTWQTSLIFLSLLIFTRILGKTQIGQLTFYEYINGITMGSIAGSMASSEPDKFWNNCYDLLIFALLTFLLSYITIKNRSLRKIIEGSPTLVIENGCIIKKNMLDTRYDLDELNAQLRGKDVFDMNEVQYATLEPTGQLSVMLKPDFQPLTKGDMNIHLQYATLPVEIIMDGQIIEESLNKAHLTHTWLKAQLTLRQITSHTDIMYAVIDSKGQLFISAKGSSQ